MVIVDGMAILHTLQQMPVAYKDLTEKLMRLLLRQADGFGPVSRVDFACDRHQPVSIKSLERTDWSTSGAILVKITKSTEKCPKHWQKLLADDLSKKELISFLPREKQSPGYSSVLVGKELYMTVECHRLTSGGKHSR